MSSSALVNGVRRALAQRSSAAATRSFRSTAPKRYEAGSNGEPAYIHAPEMYDIGAMKYRKLTIGTAILSIVLIGGSIPVYAVHFQQTKAGTYASSK
eukprot:CAMPEP_0197575038 /NCGR_PEP_ID=MMETSP1326-20131121/580_1 /TAXON_ID=1155430 /ORGANISM="Genus nov. species nov., Strain RCC2288" /LENGTH=96 /DNA_ID=CAMNT_0043137733 /DNA_START=51 /DNA_END=341 /DNA_ORIENTATION=-